MLITSRVVVLSALMFGVVAVVPARADALDLGLAPGRYMFGCEAETKALTLNGVPVVKAGDLKRCDTINSLRVRIGGIDETQGSYVDLRGLTLLRPEVNPYFEVAGIGSRIHGSPNADDLRGSGAIYGYGGGDTVFNSGPPGASVVTYGGAGDDRLYCYGTGDCAMYGSSGNDQLSIHEGGVALGGDGDDVFLVGIQQRVAALMDGGAGSDTVRAFAAGYGAQESRLDVVPGATVGSVRVISEPFDQTVTRIEAVEVRVGTRTTTMTMSSSYPIAVSSGNPLVTITLRVPGGNWTTITTELGYLVQASGLRDVTIAGRSDHTWVVAV